MGRKPKNAPLEVPFIAQDRSLSIYLKGISDSKPLTSQEEALLAVRIRKGDQAAVHKLVVANLRFVVSVSRNYQHQGLPLTDLINEGNCGLLNAAQRFDERKNFRFISYAVWWIRQAILQALAENSRIVRVPLNRVGSIYKIGLAQRTLEQRFKRAPTIEEIAAELKISAEDVEMMRRVSNRAASLDAPLFSDHGGDLHDLLPAQQEHVDEKLTAMSLESEVNKALKILDERERKIVALSFGIGYEVEHTLEEIGCQFGITRERVRQIRERALAKLSKVASRELLMELCGSNRPIPAGAGK